MLSVLTRAGDVCGVYQRCYSPLRVCYQTDYKHLDYTSATEHCVRQGNLSKPMILRRAESKALRDYIETSPVQVKAGGLWLAAEAQRLPANNAVHWSWINGKTTRELMCQSTGETDTTGETHRQVSK